MPRFRGSLSLIAIFFLWTAGASALEAPVLRSYVTDLAGVIPANEREDLDARLRAYESRTSNQFVVLVVPSLEGESLEEYSLAVAERNGIGTKGKDNGVLLLVAVAERKLRFEVGYGLEGVLTDALTSEIIRDAIVPEFRSGDYGKGIAAGMDAAMRAAAGEYVAPPRSETPARRHGSRGVGSLVFFIIFIFFFIRLTRRRGGKGGGGFFIFPGGFGGGGWGGGGFGGGGFGGGGGFSGGGGGFGGGGSSGSW